MNPEEHAARGAASVLAAAAALPTREGLSAEVGWLEAACARGYFLPNEDERVRLRYSQYLALRAALLETLAETGGAAGRNGVEWRDRLPAFIVAFAAACVLMRANRFLVELAADRPVVWKKLDEEDPKAGLPKKSFTAIYKSISRPSHALRFLEAADFHFSNREEILAFGKNELFGPVVELLLAEEPQIERQRRKVLKRTLAYRWYSFLRRHRTAWQRVMFGLFEVSGRTISELRQPGTSMARKTKRITAELCSGLVPRLRAGDVFVTRHDDALSNWFLPGFWPHAALYLGNAEDLRKLGLTPNGDDDGCWFLEAKKDGVKIRHMRETLAVDAFVVLRPPLEGAELDAALKRAIGHEGKPYDFLFDFRTAERLACTEVVYRTYHGVGPVDFHLEEVGGRLCLPAEEFLNQAMDCGFRIFATGGLRGNRLWWGVDAELAFHASRQPI